VKYNTLMQYPMGVDFALAGIGAFQAKRSFPYRMDREEFFDYLYRFRRDDPLVTIPDEEVPDIIYYSRPDSTNLMFSKDGGLGGNFIMNEIILEWRGGIPYGKFHRPTGPARVAMFDYVINFKRGEIHGERAITCNSIHCDWWQNGSLLRDGGPRSVKIREFHMKRFNGKFQEPAIRWDFNSQLTWEKNVDPNTASGVLRKLGIRLRYTAVHENPFPSSQEEYLFMEEMNKPSIW